MGFVISKIILVTGSTNTKKFLIEQLKEFIPNSFSIEGYASEDEQF